MKTTITVSKHVKNELNKLKYLYGFQTIEEVIIKYLKIKEEKDENKKID